MTCGNALRLNDVPGFEGRTNDIVYCHPNQSSPPTGSVVVYFGGDVQDYPEKMETHKETKQYLKWNLENVSTLLHSFFPQEHIVVVRPSRMEYKTFSCFDNFVPGDNTGVPDHVPNHNALLHLHSLLNSVSQRLHKKEPGSKLNTLKSSRKHLDEAHLKLIGFSKGCVVLNQFLYEFHYISSLTPEDRMLRKFVDRIGDMYWLDGGHSGGRNTWVTSQNILETLARLRIRVHIHVTPYQMNDNRKPWLRKEEKSFRESLLKLGAPVLRTLHFEDKVPSLASHFELLSTFAEVI